MFFDRLADIPEIATRTSCTIFAVPENTPLKLKNALYLRPDDGAKTQTRAIRLEALREFISHANSRESRDRFFVIAPADAMTPGAQNAFLKTFEEPSAHCHFILLTETPSALLPTILSRAQLFVPRRQHQLSQPVQASAKINALAGKLLTTASRDLPALAEEIAKIRPQPRSAAQDAVAIAIEKLYKSYFKTGDPKWLRKLPPLLALHSALAQNGNLKLQIVAQLC